MLAKSFFPLLETILDPSDVRALSTEELCVLCNEIRLYLIDTVAQTGGHLGANLGVVELTVALHYVFFTPKDKLIWDIGHQGYVHKILTNRRLRMHTLRQGGGLSGFLKRNESIYDVFGAGHSSTSLSAGLGIAIGRDILKEKEHVICVIGDGAMSAGVAFEALNNIGSQKSKIIIVLNDNDMSISTPVGALSRYLSKLVTSVSYQKLRHNFKELIKPLPRRLKEAVKLAEKYVKDVQDHGSFFEDLGIQYVGPIDGHDISCLKTVFENVKQSYNGPIIIHVVTQKGKGYEPAEESCDKFHGVQAFNVETGTPLLKPSSSCLTYTNVFSRSLIEHANKDKTIVAITAAMSFGTGLSSFAEIFPDRFFDVGIAEQHAVLFAAGMALKGLKPFVAIYSTFLQRAYDQVIHDVCIQNLPVRFMIDRAGLSEQDGPTHAGSFDSVFLSCLPNMTIMAPSSGKELIDMIATCVLFDKGPVVIRYPKLTTEKITTNFLGKSIDIGKGCIKKEGYKSGVAVLSVGTALFYALRAHAILEKEKHIHITVADARFIKPIDEELVVMLLKKHRLLIILEEAVYGGVCSQVLKIAETFYFDNKEFYENGISKNAGAQRRCLIKILHLPDFFQSHNDLALMHKEAKIDVDTIVDTIGMFFARKS